ncbi:MAG: DUF5312 domain-containing protein [Treponema sp.]|nr:DUF5312 domain-containing protein [Treponema sp.]
MPGDDSRGTFDKLVAGLTTEERVSMLNDINATTEDSLQFVETESVDDGKNLTLYLRYKNESLLYKIILWFRGLISKQSAEKVYSDDILAALAHRINRAHPGLVNHKLRSLDGIFYERLKSLKEASDFFKPYMIMIEDNPGDFYVFLSTLITPEIEKEINEKSDPFTLDFSTDDSTEVKNGLVRAMDECLKNINQTAKANLYSAICSVNWLSHFCKLPYLHFLAQFTTIIGSVYTCPYRNAVMDYDALASVFTNINSITNEVLEGIFLFSQRGKITENAQKKDIERAVKEFLAKANQQLIPIQMFISSVPVTKVGKLVNDNYDWSAQTMSGAEAWFAAFRSQHRRILDSRWNEWVREKKKNSIGVSLMADFNLKTFPSLQYQPWRELWTYVPFNYELTGGFLNWYVNHAFDKMAALFNEVMLEGIFVRNEKRIEFSEGLNLFNQAGTQMKELLTRLSPEGDYGHNFEEIISSRVLTLQTNNKIDSMMTSIESEIREIIVKFLRGGKTIDLILSSLLDESAQRKHDILQNLKSIKGHHNKEWRESLTEEKDRFKKVIYYLTELDVIDSTNRI